MSTLLLRGGITSRAPVLPKAETAVDTSDAYAQTVLGITGLVAYWRLGQDNDTANLADASGNVHHGSYPNSPASFGASELAGAISTSDGEAVDFGGVGYGEVAHDAAFSLARGTLSFYFKATSTAIANDHQIVTKNASGNNAGDMGVRLRGGDGTLRLFVQNGTNSFNLDTPGSIIEAGVEYHVAVMWDEISIWLMLDGRYVDWLRNDLLSGGVWDLSSNTTAWQFARGFDGTLGDVVIDEVALYDNRLAWSDVDTLSEWARGLAYPTTPDTSEEVGTAAAIETALTTNVSAGHHILIQPGSYDMSAVGQFIVSGSGAKRNPCVLRARDGAGTVTLRDLDVEVTGDWIVFADFDAERCHISAEPGSRYGRVTRVFSDELDGPEGVSNFRNGLTDNEGIFWRFDHIEVTDTNGTSIDTPFNIETQIEDPLAAFGGLYDHIHAHDFTDTGTQDREVWLVGSSSGADDELTRANCTFYKNRTENINTDAEDMSLKASGHLIIEWTAHDATFNAHRSGGWSWFEGCYFEGGWQRILCVDNVWIGVQLQDSDAEVYMTDTSRADFEAGLLVSGYPQTDNLLAIGLKTAGVSEIIVGSTRQRDEIPVTDAVFRECGTTTYTNAGVNDTGTVETGAGTAPIPYTVGTELLAASVGTAADDPLVPSGNWA